MHVSQVRYPVTEGMIQKVFEGVAPVRQVHVTPSANSEEAQVVVQFSSVEAAEAALQARNNRNIYSDCNKMTMTFTRWWDVVPDQAVLSSPPVSNPALFGAPQQAVYHQQPQQAVQQPVQQFQHTPPFAQMQQHQAAMPTPSMQQMAQPQVVMMAPGNSMMLPGMAANGGMAAMGAPFNPMGGAFNPMALMGGMSNMPFDPMHNMAASQGMRGGAMMGVRGGRGAGLRVGQPNPMMQGMMAPNMMIPTAMNAAAGNAPTVYLSIAFLSTETPLQALFVLLEAYGGVVSIRRNQNKPEIITVKMATTQDADHVVQYVRNVPLGPKTINAKRFAQYQEKYPCSDEQNPFDAATLNYDFTTSRHRSPLHRSKASPSRVLKITLCPHTEEELMAFFTECGMFPENITKEGDHFLVRMDTVENAVRLLVDCQNRVCNEEKSNVIFVEDPLGNATSHSYSNATVPHQAATPENESE